jgi:hypothetical protein
VSVDVSPYVTNTGYAQMQIPKFLDNNSNGSFDLFDLGIFMGSGNNGPTDKDIANVNAQNLSLITVDSFGPKINLTNLVNNQTIDTDSFTIEGMIRDQGNTSIKDRNVLIDGQKYAITNFNDVTYLWQYDWQNISSGEHKIKVMSSDQNGNPGESSEITVIRSSPVVPPIVPPVTPPTGRAYSYGDLIKAAGDVVYYYGNDAKRYVFPNLNTYNSWYVDFSTVKTITDTELASIAIGGNVTYRPGVKLVKIDSDPKVYAVDHGGTLRWVTTEALAISLYGANWGSLVQDVAVTLFVVYPKGADITTTADYSPAGVMNAATSINVDKGL